MRKLCFIILLTSLTSWSFAQSSLIDHFLVKENLLKNSKLAIIAADSLERPLEYIQGTYTFSANGFEQSLKFNDGIAVLQLPIEKSTFVFIKHQNDHGTHSKLIYVYKEENNLSPYEINRSWLIFIPLGVILLAFAFRKFIVYGLIILALFTFFNLKNGLNISTYFDSIFSLLKF